MNPDFTAHLKHQWPLALVAAGLFLYLLVVLTRGVFYTNQGSILRSRDPEGYWRWVGRFLVLLIASLAVLLGSYALSRSGPPRPEPRLRPSPR